jgi:hypothetical protein
MCLLSILIKRLILILPEIHRVAIVSHFLLGFDAARSAWQAGRHSILPVASVAFAIAKRTTEGDKEHKCL